MKHECFFSFNCFLYHNPPAKPRSPSATTESILAWPHFKDFHPLRRNYQGSVFFLESQRSRLQAELDLSQDRYENLKSTVDLYRALGGG